MDARIALQPAYVLHRTPFQNSSFLIDFFTVYYCRVRAVARGARGEKSRTRSILQPFQPLLISLSGRTDLKTLTSVEPMHEALRLEATRLFSSLYINELLTRLLQDHEEHRALYGFYQDTLVSLQGDSRIDSVLRHFELSLLSELGYGLDLESECDFNREIEETHYYRFDAKRGFTLARENLIHQQEGTKLISESENAETLIPGSAIIALREADFDSPENAKFAKLILRRALAEHLGNRPLNSRSLFMQRPRR